MKERDVAGSLVAGGMDKIECKLNKMRALKLGKQCKRRFEEPPDSNDPDVSEALRLKDQLMRNMFHAVLSESISLVRRYIDMGAPLNEFLGNQTLLHYAIVLNQVEIVRILLCSGANPHLLDNQEQSPLQLAVFKGSSRIVELLLNARANVHYIPQGRSICWYRNSYHNKRTILHDAAMRGNKAIVKMLLDHNADIHAVDHRGLDVLGFAAAGYPNPSWNDRADRDSLVKYLISRGAKILHDGPQGENKTFHSFLRNGTSQGLQIFLDNLKHEDLQNQPVVHSALQNTSQYVEMTKLLLDTGALDLEVRDSSGNTALHKAVWSHLTACVDLLLHNEADPNSLNKLKQTPLYIAVLHGNLPATKSLLEHDAQLYTETCWNILEFAVKNSDGLSNPRESIVRLLVRCIALLESQGHQVETEDIELIEKNPKELKYYQGYKAELAILKNFYIPSADTYYNIVTGKIAHECPDENHVINDFLDSQFIKQEFPVYGERMLKRFARQQNEFRRTQEALKGLSRVIPFDLDAFPHLARRILSSLRIIDLKNLSKV